MMQAGDTCLIRSGTYRETVIAPSGTTFQAYNPSPGNAATLESVTISGADPITGWTSESANIYRATEMPSGMSYSGNVLVPWQWATLGEGNQVFQGVGANVQMKPLARYPNANATTHPWQNSGVSPSPDWLYVDTPINEAHTGNATFSDAGLPDQERHVDGYWNGARVHIFAGFGWVSLHPKVTAYTHSTKTIVTDDTSHLNAGGSYTITQGNEYYLSGIKGEMDSDGEWFFDAAASGSLPANRLCFYSSTGAPANVQIKSRFYGFDLAGKTSVVLKDLRFFACTIKTDSGTSRTTYDGLTMEYLGHYDALDSPNSSHNIFGLTLREGDVLRNSRLAWDFRGLVRLEGNNIRVVNNSLSDSGYIGNWEAAIGSGTGGSTSGNLISHNTIQRAGRAALGFPGKGSIVEYNDMSDAMKLTTDGAIVYTGGEAGNTIVRYNKFHGSPGPVGHIGSGVQGFYIDNENSNWVVHHNLIYDLPGYAVYVNCRQNFDKIFNNTCWNTGEGGLHSSFPMNDESGTQLYNNLFNGPAVGKTWGLSDLRFNLHDNSAETNTEAVDAGIAIPGVTDQFPSVAVGAPDLGALEAGGTDWRPSVGNTLTAEAAAALTFNFPTMTFANQVVDGSFETGAFSPNWTVASGGNVTMLPRSNAWTDVRYRSGFRSVMFGEGSSEISQVVGGLRPGRRYKVYGGVRRTDGSSTVKLGVRGFHGTGVLERVADVVNRATPLAAGEGSNSDGTWWTMYNRSFVMGANQTTAEIYLNVNVPAGGVPVYAEDFCVQLMEDPSVDPVLPMPSCAFAFEETGGTVAYDSTTNGRNGTVFGGATWSAGRVGNALNFDGSNDYVTVSGAVPATPQGSFTVATWVKFDTSLPDGYGTELASNNYGSWGKKGWLIKVVKDGTGGGLNLGLYILSMDQPSKWVSGTYASVGLQSSIVPGTWAHVAFVVDRQAGSITGYLNGEKGSQATIPAGFTDVGTALPLLLGTRSMKGQMDDFRVYDSALSSSDIKAVKNADTAKTLQLELDESPGATRAWDASGTNNNGTLRNINTATAWTGSALTFDDVDDYVETPKSTPATPFGSFTVATWVKFDGSTTKQYSTLVRNSNSGWGAPGWIVKTSRAPGVTNFSVVLYMWDGVTTQNAAVSGGSVQPGQWAHLAFVVNRDPTSGAGTLKSYVNGVLYATKAIPAGFQGANTSFGTRVGDAGFRGQLDDVRIYSRALSWDEVLDLVKPQDGLPY